VAKFRHKVTNQLETVDAKSVVGKMLSSSPSWIRLDPETKPEKTLIPKKEVKKEIKKD